MNAVALRHLTPAGELRPLVPVALAGLEKMQDPSGLFSHKSLLMPHGTFVNQGVDPLYTAACAVGLQSCEEARRSPHTHRSARALDALLEREHERDPAVLGTALWGCALAGDDRAPLLARRLIGTLQPRRLSSMRLGLALTGLAQWLAVGDAAAEVGPAARTVAAELERRFVARAHVFAAGARPPSRNPLLQRLTSFASQVYPVLGLCELALATGTEPPPAVGRVCDFLAEAQGDRGQWWWFYSTTKRRVMEGYPVYSVHQDAMAPMALLSAGRARVGDYARPLIRGIRWVGGDNELDQSMVNPRAGLIYRAIQRAGGDADGFAGWSRPQRWSVYRGALTGRPAAPAHELEILRESRSYHLGWLLVAAGMAREAA
jgi:hypothetical protein